MLFGLCNGPSTFTTLVNLVFHDKLDEFLVIYIDGIFIYSKMDFSGDVLSSKGIRPDPKKV
jgi:hypothetical protein